MIWDQIKIKKIKIKIGKLNIYDLKEYNA